MYEAINFRTKLMSVKQLKLISCTVIQSTAKSLLDTENRM
jgi:hypothetical protein